MHDKSESQLPPDCDKRTRIRDIVVRQLTTKELTRASEIDVSESGHVVYKCADDVIHPEKEN
jgi:hypothetical protein